jgi:hypothetical protein
MELPKREFTASQAVRRAVGLIIGIVAPSGAGKTYSALRLGAGISRVCGGKPFLIDTENGRALYYADTFDFVHVPMAAPFSPLDYMAAMQFCVDKGAKTIITDSMSHEHEGQGGVLEWHDQELQRLAGDDYAKQKRMGMLAWQKPKAARKQLMLWMNQANVNFISTFRAKEKLKLQAGKDPLEMGFQPIAGEELIYEMVLKMLLLPGAEGVPTWQSEYPGERAMMKLPDQFRPFFDRAKPTVIDEALGVKLAEWAAGVEASPLEDLIDMYEKAVDEATFEQAQAKRRNGWVGRPAADKKRLTDARDAAEARLKAAK